MPERWRTWLLTGEAAFELIFARLTILIVPLRKWKSDDQPKHSEIRIPGTEVHRLARHILRAAQRLPFASNCLPRAMALSRMLRRRAIAHRLVIASRPASHRVGADDLHAWVEVDGEVVLGELPGPWLVIHTLQ